jgi:hypothetical protein
LEDLRRGQAEVRDAIMRLTEGQRRLEEVIAELANGQRKMWRESSFLHLYDPLPYLGGEVWATSPLF